MTVRTSIELSFLGGATAIGASCTLVRVGGTTLLVDCGVRYSGSSVLPDLSALAETTVDAVLLTHAHMDHSGGLPVATEACRGAPVLATPPTIDLVGTCASASGCTASLATTPDSMAKPEATVLVR